MHLFKSWSVIGLGTSGFRLRLKADLRRQRPAVSDLVEVDGLKETGHQRPAKLYKAREGFVFLD